MNRADGTGRKDRHGRLAQSGTPMTPVDALTMKGLGAAPMGQTEGAEIEPGLGG